MSEIISRVGEIPQEIWIVAKRLGDLRDKVVFVGGAVVGALLTDTGASKPRPTDDIDLIVEIASTGSYYQIEQNLRSLGFKHDMTSGAPICRWVVDGIKVDVMPSQDNILGFSNRWYPEAIVNYIRHTSAYGEQVQLISATYFVATKLTAFHGRGNGDYRGSHDIEDIISIVDGRTELASEIEDASLEVKRYLVSEVGRLLSTPA